MMRVVLFCHSLRSDWNHGNVHFLRGVYGELERRGHDVASWEPCDAWSALALARREGPDALDAYRERYPALRPRVYDPARLDLDRVLDGADLVIVHEWTSPELVAAIGRRRTRGGRFRLLFHDTHHRSASRASEIEAIDLSGFDGVLAFGEVIRARYERLGWSRRAWTWHEAADTSVFRPITTCRARAELVWIGNWGDEERTAELGTYLLEPSRALGLSGHVYGVGYPPDALRAVADAGLAFGGRIPNHRVPEVFGGHMVTVHVPRRPYATSLPGIPTIRIFEALACGIPLVSAPWDDVEGLFAPGRDFLMARTRIEMQDHLRDLLSDPDYADEVARTGLRTIRERHTCAHRVDALVAIAQSIGVSTASREVV